VRHLKAILVDTVRIAVLLAVITIAVYMLLSAAATVQADREAGRGFYGEVTK